jgi:CRP/FNR family transcriptional regulator, cyclic AMP receptor protein
VAPGRTSPRDLPLFANLTGGQIKETNRLRTATVTAQSRLQLQHFGKADFDRLTDSIPGFRKTIDQTIADRRGETDG